MKVYSVIDRFEGETAVLEDPHTRLPINVPRASLPEGAREGDCLYRDGAGGWHVDAAETASRAAAVRKKFGVSIMRLRADTQG